MFIVVIIVLNLLMFLGMLFVLHRFMGSASYDETKRLQQQNLENAQKAVELEQKIEEAEKHYKERLVHAEEESKKLKERAIKEAETIKEQMLAKARDEKDRLIEQAINAKEKVREEIEGGLVEKSLGFARRIIAEILNDQQQKVVYDALLNDVFAAMENIDANTFKGAKHQGRCRIQSSQPLQAQQKQRLIKILSEKTGENISLEEIIDKDLIAGIIVQVGSFRVDGSLTAKFKKAAESIRHAA